MHQQSTTSERPVTTERFAWRTRETDRAGRWLYGGFNPHTQQVRFAHIHQENDDYLYIRGEHEGAQTHRVIIQGTSALHCDCPARPGTCYHLVVAEQYLADCAASLPEFGPVQIAPETAAPTVEQYARACEALPGSDLYAALLAR